MIFTKNRGYLSTILVFIISISEMDYNLRSPYTAVNACDIWNSLKTAC
jgi:hypothetical protein